MLTKIKKMELFSIGIGILLFFSCSNNSTSAEVANKQVLEKKTHQTVSDKTIDKIRTDKHIPKSSLPNLSQPHYVVFSLFDNRPLAHLIRNNGLFILAGQPGFVKYLQFRRPWNPWEINQKEDNKKIAFATNSVTWVSFPLTQEQTQSKKIFLRVESPKEQGIRIEVNNKTALPTKTLTKGWQVLEVQVPEKTFHTGENRIDLKWGVKGILGGKKVFGAVEWIYIGDDFSEQQAVTKEIDGTGFYLPPNGGFAYYVFPYKDAKLRLRFDAQPKQNRCSLKVRVLPQRGQEIAVVLEETEKSSGQTETYVDLSSVSEQVGRLEVLATGQDCKGIRLDDAAIVMPGQSPRVKYDKRPKNVIFWMVDNARSDRYKLYNPKTRVETPVISKLGETGTVFTKAYITGTESRISHASIWTGLYPKQHQFISPTAKLNLNWVTLSEAVQKGGLKTFCWVANGWISKKWGYGEGWNFFHNTLHDGGGLSAKDLADHSIKLIKEKGNEPFYLYVGTIDPHVSWRARDPWLQKYYKEPYDGPYKKAVFGKDVEKMATGKRPVSDKDKKRILAVYDATVSYNDYHLGRVLETLEAMGIRDQTMIVVTADHGEELWDFGRIGHGHSLRHSLVDVPYIIHYPPLFGKGVRVREGVNAASAMATILDAIGTPIPENVQFASVLPLTQGVGQGYPRPSIATQYELAHTIRLENYKLWVGGKGEPNLYDLSSKKGEGEEIAQKEPQVTRWLTDCLSTFLFYQPYWRESRWGVASNLISTMATDLESDVGPKEIKP